MPTRAPDRPHALAGDLPSPQASRVALPRWLDVRLLVGVGLVLASILLGARVVSAADDTVAVWATRAAIQPGQALREDALVARQVRLDDGVGAYVAAGPVVPSDWVVTRAVGAGELLPRAALAAPGTVDVRYVTVAVPRDELPYAAVRGSRVEVWSAPSSNDRDTAARVVAGSGTAAARAAGAPGSPQRLLGATTVQDVVAGDSAFGASTSAVPVVLAIRSDQATAARPVAALVADVLAASRAGRLYLVGLPADTAAPAP